MVKTVCNMNGKCCAEGKNHTFVKRSTPRLNYILNSCLILLEKKGLTKEKNHKAVIHNDHSGCIVLHTFHHIQHIEPPVHKTRLNY